jgi:hypothetical protein
MQKTKRDEFDMDVRWYRSLFLPFTLIGVGALFLMSVMGILSAEQSSLLLRFSPILLMALGVDLLIGRTSPLLGGGIALVAMGIWVGLSFIGVNFGWANPPQLVSEDIRFSNDNYDAYSLNLDGGLASVDIYALEDTNLLLDGTVNHYENLNFESEVDENEVNFTLDTSGFNFFLPNFWNADETIPSWRLGLAPGVPVSLDIDGGVGEMTLDLRNMVITDARLKVGVGTMIIQLPEPEASYEVRIDGGVGETNITLPDGVAVRINAQAGVGSLNIQGLERIGAESDSPVGDEGVWQSAGYDNADIRIDINYDGDVGSLNVR